MMPQIGGANPGGRGADADSGDYLLILADDGHRQRAHAQFKLFVADGISPFPGGSNFRQQQRDLGDGMRRSRTQRPAADSLHDLAVGKLTEENASGR